MHGALLISDVLSCIINYLGEGTAQHSKPSYAWAKGTQGDGRRALAVLARTCRTFSEPALDALWRRLHSLEPFILCLPTKAAHSDAIVDLGALPAFDDDEWNVLLRYAPRVQELSLDHDPLAIRILQSLWFRTTLLLPNLRKLRWFYQDHAVIASIRLLLSPSLVHLCVWLVDGDHSSVLGLLECYHALCPNLRSLHIGHSGYFPHVTTAVSRAICRSSSLEDLMCDPINEAAWIHIAKSRCLRRLSVDLVDHEPEDLKRVACHTTFDHAPFEDLRILKLRFRDLSSFVPYLKSHQQPFEEISFCFHTVPAPEAFHEFFTALGSATRQGTLRRIKLLSLGSGKRRVPSHTIDFQVLSPVTTLNLRTFDVNVSGSVSLGDDELARLVRGWPDLETFRLNQRKGCADDQAFHMPTLRGLLLLVAQCPKLRNIGLRVDATSIPSLSEDESLIYNTAITRLSFASSPIQKPVESVVHFLLEHFPSLTALSTYYGQPWHDLWRKADVLVGELSAVNGLCSGSESESSDSEVGIGFPRFA